MSSSHFASRQTHDALLHACVAVVALGLAALSSERAAAQTHDAVVVNGRRLPAAELAMLQLIVGPVLPGRYWLDAQGNAGFEGGPPLVNILAAARQAGRRGAGGWNRNTLGGNWGGDGDCSYYSHPDGPSVMIGAC